MSETETESKTEKRGEKREENREREGERDRKCKTYQDGEPVIRIIKEVVTYLICLSHFLKFRIGVRVVSVPIRMRLFRLQIIR